MEYNYPVFYLLCTKVYKSVYFKVSIIIFFKLNQIKLMFYALLVRGWSRVTETHNAQLDSGGRNVYMHNLGM